MEHETKTFRSAMDGVLTGVAASSEQSAKASRALEVDRKRHFLTMMLRWQSLFKRADSGSIEADKWLIAEYFKSLGHLSHDGLEALTEQLKAKCTFFPTIRECLEIINVPQLSGQWGNPFINRPAALYHDEKKALEHYRAVGAIGDYRGEIDG